MEEIFLLKRNSQSESCSRRRAVRVHRVVLALGWRNCVSLSPNPAAKFPCDPANLARENMWEKNGKVRWL